MQTRKLAEFASALRYVDLPQDARDLARDCVQDTAGLSVFGALRSLGRCADVRALFDFVPPAG